MILAMMVLYVFALHLVFNVFKWANPTTRNKIYVTALGLFAIYCVLLVINLFQPMSTDLRVFRGVAPISPVVAGLVVDVPVEANAPIAKGEVLFQIDRVPYAATVGQLEAQLALAKLRSTQSKALARQKAGSVYDVEAFGAQVRQLEASLRAARYNLEQTSVRAPANGHVSDIALRPGQVVAPGMQVMSFVDDDLYVLGATFRQEVINRIQPGDEAEIALDTYPGRTFSAKVLLVDPDIPQGQVVASGRIIETGRTPHGFVFVNLELKDDEGLKLAAGEAGAAAVYTSSGQALIPIRKVFFRWYTWLNYIIAEMDIRGRRQ